MTKITGDGSELGSEHAIDTLTLENTRADSIRLIAQAPDGVDLSIHSYALTRSRPLIFLVRQ